MRISCTSLPGVIVIEPKVHSDDRGYLFESYNQSAYAVCGIDIPFVQDNHSVTRKGVLRGLHYQAQKCQGKLVRAISGEIFDVAVDVRKHSPTLGRWTGMRLSAANRLQLYVPPGFAHGFLALTENAEVLYKMTDFYAPEHERCIIWNDPDLNIEWPLEGSPVLSPKDAAGCTFSSAELPSHFF